MYRNICYPVKRVWRLKTVEAPKLLLDIGHRRITLAVIGIPKFGFYRNPQFTVN